MVGSAAVSRGGGLEGGLASADEWLRRRSVVSFVVLNALLCRVVTLPLTLLFVILGIGGLESGPVFDGGPARMFVETCVLAPLLETFLFQWLPIRLMQRFGCRREISMVLVSALLFWASHWYSYYYCIYAFLIGLVLAYAFLACDKVGRKPFWIVSGIHALVNLTVFVPLVLFGDY